MWVNWKVWKVLFPESLDRFQITNFLKKSLWVPPKFSNEFTYAISWESIVSTTKWFEQWVRKTFDSEIDLCELEWGEVFPFTVYLEDKFLLFRDKNHNELPSWVVDIRQNTATEVFLAMAQTSSMTERKNLINQEFLNVFFIDPIAGYDLVPADAQIFSDEQLSSFLNNVAWVYQKDTDEDNLHEMFFSENKLNFEEYFWSDYAFSRVRIFICGENIVISHGEKRMFLSFWKQSISLSETLLLGIDELWWKVDIPEWIDGDEIQNTRFNNLVFHSQSLVRYWEITIDEYRDFLNELGDYDFDSTHRLWVVFINRLISVKYKNKIGWNVEAISLRDKKVLIWWQEFSFQLWGEGVILYKNDDIVLDSEEKDRLVIYIAEQIHACWWDLDFIRYFELEDPKKLLAFIDVLKEETKAQSLEEIEFMRIWDISQKLDYSYYCTISLKVGSNIYTISITSDRESENTPASIDSWSLEKVNIPDWCNERSIGQKTYEYFDNYAFHPDAIRRYGEPTQVEYVEFCKAIQVLFHWQMSLPDDLKWVQKWFINNLRVSKSNNNISWDIEWFSITPQVISLWWELYKYEVINQGIFFYNLEEEVPSVSEDRARRELMRNLFPDDWDYEHWEFIKSLSLTSSIKLQKFFQELERIIRDNFNRDINVDDWIEVSEFWLPLECIFYSEDDNVSLEIDIQINRDYVITVKEVGGLAW